MTFWTAVRPRSRILVLAAVFCLFGAVGLTGMQMSATRFSAGTIISRVLLTGGFAIAYFVLLINRRFWYFGPLVVVQAVVMWAVVKGSKNSESLTGSALQNQLVLLAMCTVVGIIAAYSLMIHFFTVEGKRYFEMRTEMALAAEIHRSLVPACAVTVGGFEIYGASVPSGDVGGDLVDVVEKPGGWIGYVADVSGHGVQSGVLMAMFKTALRTQTSSSGSLARMLADVNQTLFPLKLESMFVTVGMLQGDSSGRISFASAGHPAILHYQKKTGAVKEYAALDPPLGIAARQEFSEAMIACDAGDVLLVLTDGLTEVFNAKGGELGLDPLRVAFQASAGLPLEEIFLRLRKVAGDFGPQVDDQTALLTRRR